MPDEPNLIAKDGWLIDADTGEMIAETSEELAHLAHRHQDAKAQRDEWQRLAYGLEAAVLSRMPDGEKVHFGEGETASVSHGTSTFTDTDQLIGLWMERYDIDIEALDEGVLALMALVRASRGFRDQLLPQDVQQLVMRVTKKTPGKAYVRYGRERKRAPKLEVVK